MNTIPPAEFYEIGLNPDAFRRSCPKSWRGPCPRCGGQRRFVVFTDRTFPLWHAYCDQCGYKVKYWQVVRKPLTEAEIAAAKARIEADEAEQAKARLAKLAEFSTEELWLELHRRMTEDNYAWWALQGVPHDWADFWQLGYTPSRPFEHDGKFFERPAYAIPKFDLKWRPMNIDYRLINPPVGVGKYRPAKGLSSAAFLSRPDWEELGDQVVVVEGSKKAMVVAIYTPDRSDNVGQVVGIPGCSSWAGMPERLKDCGRVWIALDPDATAWAYKLAEEIGKNARIVELPCKPDDAWLNYGMTPRLWERYLHGAVKL